MKEKFFSCLMWIILPTSLSNTAFPSVFIEGFDDTLLIQQSKTLESVFNVFFHSSTNYNLSRQCTSVLVSKDVILTAKHCTDAKFSDGGGVSNYFDLLDKNKKRLLLQIVSLVASPNSDIALIKLANIDNPSDLNYFHNISPIPVNLDNNSDMINGKILLTGYGKSSRHSRENPPRPLKAGFNYVVEANSTLNWIFSNVMRPYLNNFDPNSIHFLGIRNEVYTNTFKIGDDIEVEDIMIEQSIPENQAICLPGDSGGPAIAFRSDNSPVVIGVGSWHWPYTGGSTITEIKIKNIATNEEKTYSFSKALDENFPRNVELLNDTLKELGYTKLEDGSDSPKIVALVPFSYTYKINRIAANQYVSTSENKNAEFITATLKSFESLNLLKK